MGSAFPRLMSAGWIGRIRTRNRVVMLPLSTNLANEDGGVTPEMVDYYAERARGGVGLVIVEGAAVDYPRGRNGAVRLRCDEPRFVPGLGRLVDAVHSHGAGVLLQLQHAGFSTNRENTFGRQPVAPSVLVRDGRVAARGLHAKEIREIVRSFGLTARYAVEAGFDGVEIHSAHSYLLAEFLSPLTNKRGDEYGGDLRNRARFLLEVVEAVRAEIGADRALVVRLNGDDFMEGGLRLEDAERVAVLLGESGVDAVDISSGLENHAEGLSMYLAEGWRVHLAEGVKRSAHVPVIAGGGIVEPQFAEDVIAGGRADFVGIGRGLVAEPFWVAKAAAGRTEMLRRCIRCNVGCADRRISGLRSITCSLNPDVGREGKTVGFLVTGARRRRVIILGAGPAGLNAAFEAARRGHDVEVFEKGNDVGGALRLASLLPGKERLKAYIQYLRQTALDLGVPIHLGVELTLDDVGRLNPAAMVVATGGGAVVPRNIPGIGSPTVVTAHEWLGEGRRAEGKRMVVIGGGSTGCEIAAALAAANRVIIVEARSALAIDMGRINREALLRRLAELEVGTLLNSTVSEITRDGVMVRRPDSAVEIAADWVLVAVGVAPVLPRWVADVDETAIEVHVVGDALTPGKLINAVSRGMALGRTV